MKVIYPGIIKRIKRMLTGNYVEDGNTASQNIASGKYVTWKNQLCKATTAITTGDTLSSSNLEAVADGGINELNSKITPENSYLTMYNNKVSYRKISEHIVEIKGNNQADISSITQFGTLPEGYRPDTDVYIRNIYGTAYITISSSTGIVTYYPHGSVEWALFYSIFVV